jgi:hypothetical protein
LATGITDDEIFPEFGKLLNIYLVNGVSAF